MAQGRSWPPRPEHAPPAPAGNRPLRAAPQCHAFGSQQHRPQPGSQRQVMPAPRQQRRSLRLHSHNDAPSLRHANEAGLSRVFRQRAGPQGTWSRSRRPIGQPDRFPGSSRPLSAEVGVEVPPRRARGPGHLRPAVRTWGMRQGIGRCYARRQSGGAAMTPGGEPGPAAWCTRPPAIVWSSLWRQTAGRQSTSRRTSRSSRRGRSAPTASESPCARCSIRPPPRPVCRSHPKTARPTARGCGHDRDSRRRMRQAAGVPLSGGLS